jgi:DNA ligase D-like protein (predicted polymerase)/DNA ligase D-like protein (predicted ligase)/DNA ligase D-like protein (predicted 3'-phosphoesterase)
MAKKYIHTEVGGQKVKLSNLDKTIYPEAQITKAQIIQYYLGIADYILPHLIDRALTVIRFPDGIDKQSFYSKDKPDWTPDWVGSANIQHDEKMINYVKCDDAASLCWLANLACLELHPMQYQMKKQPNPDHIIFDLDPDEGLDFADVKLAAQRLKPFLESYGYTPFLKTSGGKGLHIYIPIEAKWHTDTVSASVKKLAGVFVSGYTDNYTLQIPKAKRKGKILIDIYRNHSSNTTVSPFSLRGRKGAPVSLPIHWEHLADLERSNQYDINTFRDYLDEHGNAWADWQNKKAGLHDQKIKTQIANLDTSKLKDYLKKRDFTNTPEPIPEVGVEDKSRYCIQLHDATNLHYDLRLEYEGVLMSWAVPKCLPFESDQKRMAIRTEDHPIKYLDFEGTIPKGQYGAGSMWLMEKGTINWKEKSKKKYKFELSNRKGIVYHIFQTRDNQWLLDADKAIPIDEQVKPMLADAGKEIPSAAKYTFEVKWDGIRVFIRLQSDKINIISRSGRDITKHFPELHDVDRFDCEQGLFDGEIVVLDPTGAPVFPDVISRMHTAGDAAIQRLSKSKPAVCYLFDMIQLDGKELYKYPNERRRELLDCILKSGESYRFSQDFPDGKALFEAIKAKGMEGIMAKQKDAPYLPGTRCRHWLKIKVRSNEECYIIGYTAGKGDRSAVFGALHLAIYTDNNVVYKGKVGTGFDMATLKKYFALFSVVPTTAKPIEDAIEEESRTVWIEPVYRCEIQYASLTPNGTYREPVFVKLVDG